MKCPLTNCERIEMNNLGIPSSYLPNIFIQMKLLFLALFVFPLISLAQDDVNQMDTQDQRHGVWKKMYANTKQLRYEGQFEHGKEVGTFKFYCDECGSVPTATKEFNAENSIAKVKYFTKKGKLVSEGEMDGKLRIGEWVYYHKKGSQIMTRESYSNGEISGAKITYYPNGQVAEELNYLNGKMNGTNKYFAPNGTLLKDLTYNHDKLEGNAVYFDEHGQKSIEGVYRDDKKHGVWKYYKNGKFDHEETFPKPRKKAN